MSTCPLLVSYIFMALLVIAVGLTFIYIFRVFVSWYSVGYRSLALRERTTAL